MAYLYVDEAGEEGFKETSSEWFILGAVLHKDSDVPECMSHYEGFKSKRHQKDWFFHFADRKHDERVGFIQTMSTAPYQAMAMMIHKPSLTKPENFQKRYYLYFYALRLLLERATKWASETAKEDIGVILSSRKGLVQENVAEYLDRIKYSPFVQKDHIVWDSLMSNPIQIKKNETLRGLQMADCIASSLFKSVEVSEYDTLEARYIRELKPLFDRKPYKGYETVIAWPKPPFELRKKRMHWHTEQSEQQTNNEILKAL